MLHPTYNGRNEIGDGCLEPDNLGLTRFGIEVVRDCNRLGVVFDCSHAGERTSLDAIEVSEKPVIFSHSNAKSVWDNPRNITDEQIKKCAERGGVVGLNIFSAFVGDTWEGKRPTLDDLMKHADHMASLVGMDHVGIGTDFYANPGGMIWWNNNTKRRYPEAVHGMVWETHEVEPFDTRLEDYPILVAKLLEHGFNEGEVEKIIGGNWLRVFRQWWGE